MPVSLHRSATAVFLALAAVFAAHGEDAPFSPRQILGLGESAVATSALQSVRGVVTFVSGIETNRFEIAPPEQPWMPALSVRAEPGAERPAPGALVQVRGALGWSHGAPFVRAGRIDVVLNGTLGEPRGAKQSDYRRGILNRRRVFLVGFVREVRPCPNGPVPVTDLILNIDKYETRVRVPGFLEEEDYRGRLVRAVGLVRDRVGDGGAFLDAWLEVADEADVQPLHDDRLSRAVVAASALVGAVLLLAASFFLILWVRGRRARRELEVIAAERRRMAADLHDTIEQHLAGANLIAVGVMTLGDVTPDVKEAMKTLTALLANAKAEVRSAVLSLRTAGEDRRTLAEAIENMACGLEKTGVRARRCLRGLPTSLPEGVFRDIELILREATTNAVKHGRARNIVFTSDPRGRGGFTLRVLNDGEPFDAGRALGPETGHYGLSGMRERALRNRLSIAWGVDRGWTFMELVSEGL